jgi:transcriptional regulator with XRE-family HTH domain
VSLSQWRRERERFQNIIAAIIKGQRQKYAAYLDVSEATIRNWEAGASVPRANRRQLLFEKLQVPPDVLYYDDDEWRRYLENLTSSRTSRDPLIEKSVRPLFMLEEILEIESTIAPNTSVIILTSDADDLSVADVRNVVRQNILRGVSYLYVIPYDCRGKDVLFRLAESYRAHGSGRGTMNAVVVHSSSQDVEWSLVGYIFLATNTNFVANKQTVTNIEIDDIAVGFERLYKTGDVLHYKHGPTVTDRGVWVYSSYRRTNIFLNLIRTWSNDADWK